MINEEGKFTGESTNGVTELILLGHIIKNLTLLDQYGECLQRDDFETESMRILYDFLCDYYRNYGEKNPIDLQDMETHGKINALYVKWLDENESFSKHWGSKKKFKDNFKTIALMGDSHAPVDNIHYQAVKKDSCLRKLKAAGINTTFIEKTENFKSMTADDIMRLVAEKVDDLSQNCMLHPAIDLVSTIKDTACRFMVEPDQGFETPFAFINDYIHGLRKNDLTMIGANTNCGKSRLLVYILTYLVCVDKQPVLLLSNEMTKEQFQKMLICTVVNMPQLRELHRQNVHLTQAEITRPHYCSKEGELIEMLPDENYEDYIKRLETESEEFASYLKVLDWFQANYQNMFHFKNISDDYSVERIKQEIRIAKKQGCTVVAYDTLKSYGNADWSELQQTATELSELIKSDPDGITGLATFQLTDDTWNRKPEDMGSLNIANSKHIMHVADNMLMFRMISNAEFYFEGVNADGEKEHIQIPSKSKNAAFKIVKNRNGAGKDILFGVQMNLDYNVWHYVGTLRRASNGNK